MRPREAGGAPNEKVQCGMEGDEPDSKPHWSTVAVCSINSIYVCLKVAPPFLRNIN